MKKYSFVILDDENQKTSSGGWKRVFDLFLIPKNYVKKGSADITLSDTSTFIQNAEPIEVQFFKPENDSYSTIYDKISKKDYQAKKDIYFIDMNWDNEDSVKDTNVIRDMTLEKITLAEISNGKMPSELAGLNLLNILQRDNKPKIFFSASNRTENIRKVFKLLSNRVLTDDVLIGEMTGAGPNNYIDEVERKVDAYLQSRQIAIITRQKADKIQELNEIVKAWTGSIDKADEPLIPDNRTDTDPESCWSLRTLFPKQVNRIELGTDEEENKKIIYEALNELEFRKIYKWIVFNHGSFDNKSINQLCIEDGGSLVANRLAALAYLEAAPNLHVSDKSAGDYKVFSKILNPDLEEFPNECLTNIRPKIIGELSSHTSSILFTDNSAKYTTSFSDTNVRLLKTLALYGVYIGDIYFMYCSIETDNKHHFTRPPHNYQLPLEINASYEDRGQGNFVPKILTVSIEIPSDAQTFERWDRQKSLEKEAKKIEQKLKDNPYDIVLKEQAIKDYTCLFINRYKAKVEIQFGKKRLTVTSENRIPTIEEMESEKTEYMFRIEAI
jgi:hypothetical protein